jgi:hypothetical protein
MTERERFDPEQMLAAVKGDPHRDLPGVLLLSDGREARLGMTLLETVQILALATELGERIGGEIDPADVDGVTYDSVDADPA